MKPACLTQEEKRASSPCERVTHHVDVKLRLRRKTRRQAYLAPTSSGGYGNPLVVGLEIGPNRAHDESKTAPGDARPSMGNERQRSDHVNRKQAVMKPDTDTDTTPKRFKSRQDGLLACAKLVVRAKFPLGSSVRNVTWVGCTLKEPQWYVENHLDMVCSIVPQFDRPPTTLPIFPSMARCTEDSGCLWTVHAGYHLSSLSGSGPGSWKWSWTIAPPFPRVPCLREEECERGGERGRSS